MAAVMRDFGATVTDEAGACAPAAARAEAGGAGAHVAIIMDGNGRWAASRGLPRLAGHRAGAGVVRRVTREAARLGVGTLTLFAFSSDNWRRPAEETGALMRLLRVYLARETAACVRRGVRLSVVGRRDRLAPELRALIAAAEEATGGGRDLHLRLAIDYSARDEILRAADAWTSLRADAPHAGAQDEAHRRERFAALLGGACETGGASRGDGARVGESRLASAPDVDLLIRTGGEQRLSDFLLWECAYAELLFLPVMFPDFTIGDFRAALAEFAGRERRFGGVGSSAATASRGEAGRVGVVRRAAARWLE